MKTYKVATSSGREESLLRIANAIKRKRYKIGPQKGRFKPRLVRPRMKIVVVPSPLKKSPHKGSHKGSREGSRGGSRKSPHKGSHKGSRKSQHKGLHRKTRGSTRSAKFVPSALRGPVIMKAARDPTSRVVILVGVLALAVLLFFIGWISGWWWPVSNKGTTKGTKTGNSSVAAIDTTTSAAPAWWEWWYPAINFIAAAVIVVLAVLSYFVFRFYGNRQKGFNEDDDEVNKVRSSLLLKMATAEKTPSPFYENAIFILSTIVDDQTMDTEQKEEIARALGQLAETNDVSYKTMGELTKKISLDKVTEEKVSVNQAISKLVKENKLDDGKSIESMKSGIESEDAKTFATNKLTYLANFKAKLSEAPGEMTELDKIELKRLQGVTIGWANLMGMPKELIKKLGRDGKPVFEQGTGKRFFFYGRPGTGKSEAAAAMQAATPGSFLMKLTAGELGSLENQSENRIGAKFEKCNKFSVRSGKPGIILVDEADSILLKPENAIAFQLAMDLYPKVNVIFISNYPRTIAKSAKAVIDRIDGYNRVSFDKVDPVKVKTQTVQAKLGELTDAGIALNGTEKAFNNAIDKIAKDGKIGIRSSIEMVKSLAENAKRQRDKLLSPDDLTEYVNVLRTNTKDLENARDIGIR